VDRGGAISRFGGTPPGVMGTVKDVHESKGVAGAFCVRAEAEAEKLTQGSPAAARTGDRKAGSNEAMNERGRESTVGGRRRGRVGGDGIRRTRERIAGKYKLVKYYAGNGENWGLDGDGRD
jgi:hypothetical protein